MTRARKWTVILIALFALAITSCASPSYKPYEYRSDRELKPGPGLFTGEKGVYTIYKKPENREIGESEKR